jgi:putative hydrolase of the HAD superfamily
VEALEYVQSKGIAAALVCNGSIMRTNALIDRFGLRKFFRCILISEEVGYEKSTGVPFKAALRKLGLFAEQALAVGDNPEEDAEGAKKAHMRSVLVGNSAGKADFHISCISELPKVLPGIR